MSVCLAQHMKRADQINVDDYLETIRRHILGFAQKIACGTGDKHVNLSKFLNGFLECEPYRIKIPNIGANAVYLAATFF